MYNILYIKKVNDYYDYFKWQLKHSILILCRYENVLNWVFIEAVKAKMILRIWEYTSYSVPFTCKRGKQLQIETTWYINFDTIFFFL